MSLPRRNVWAFVILLALDLFWAMVIWRRYDITISSWTGLELRKPVPRQWAKILGWILDHIQKDHCELSIKGDAARAQQALEILA